MKTIDEIVSAMRALADDIEAGRAVVGQTVWRNYADLIEAAQKREIGKPMEANDAAAYAYDPNRIRKSELPDGSAYALEAIKTKELTTVGNPAAMREALVEATERLIRIVGCDHYLFLRNKHHCDFKTTMGECRNKNICETIFKAQSALSDPPRNCDVGSADEQSGRFLEFCNMHDMHDCKSGCPVCKYDNCELAWAQMPYKEGGAK